MIMQLLDWCCLCKRRRCNCTWRFFSTRILVGTIPAATPAKDTEWKITIEGPLISTAKNGLLIRHGIAYLNIYRFGTCFEQVVGLRDWTHLLFGVNNHSHRVSGVAKDNAMRLQQFPDWLHNALTLCVSHPPPQSVSVVDTALKPALPSALARALAVAESPSHTLQVSRH